MSWTQVYKRPSDKYLKHLVHPIHAYLFIGAINFIVYLLIELIHNKGSIMPIQLPYIQCDSDFMAVIILLYNKFVITLIFNNLITRMCKFYVCEDGTFSCFTRAKQSHSLAHILAIFARKQNFVLSPKYRYPRKISCTSSFN